MIKPGKFFIVSAPSGAGKTSLVSAAIERLSPYFSLERVITYTTKQPRKTDIPGKDYHFISVEEFQEKIKKGFFIEWSSSYGHYYGSGRNILDKLAQGISLISIIDRVGAAQISAQLDDVILIWIYTKDLAVLQERLSLRGTENSKQIECRLTLAQKELEAELKEGLYRHHILNDCFESALLKLEAVIKGTLEESPE